MPFSMGPWGELELVLAAVGAGVALCQGAIFRHYDRVYRREHLYLWSCSFFALGIYLAGSSLSLLLVYRGVAASDPLRLAASCASLVGAYCQVALLVMGTLAITRDRRWTRTQLAVAIGIAVTLGLASALAYAWNPGDVSERLLLRIGMRYLVTGVAYLTMGIAIAARGSRRRLGQQLAALAFALYGLELLQGFAVFIAQTVQQQPLAWARYLDVFDLVAQIFIGFALVVWLLDDERTRSERATAAVERLKHFDPYTGLPNRQRMLEHLDRQLEAGDAIALLLIRIDNLGHVAAAFGTGGVDAAISAAAERLDEVARSRGLFAARPSPDHFALQGATTEREFDAGRVAELALGALERAVGGDQAGTFTLQASVGIALAPRDAREAETLLSCAEIARARARQDGSLRYRYYAPELDAQAERRLALHGELRRAFARNEFVLEFQPILDGRSLRISSFEALVRWQHPERGRLLPDQFIHELEPLGLIEKLDSWVLERACAAALRWQQAGAPLPVGVNVSARSFQRTDFPDAIAALLRRTGLASDCLELEILESIAMEQPERAIAGLVRLRELGVRVVLDDFGTGFSSLKHLRQLPIDGIKIDHSFVTDVLVDSRDAAIVRAMLALAHSLHLSVVAEGIETPAQLAWFESVGCDRLQGFHFHRPMDLAAVVALVVPASQPSSHSASASIG